VTHRHAYDDQGLCQCGAVEFPGPAVTEMRRQGSVTAIELIAAERARQIAAEGWTPEHDDKREADDLAIAGALYALPDDLRPETDGAPDYWPWDVKWWKPTPNDRVRELVKAGALIVAEIERLQRKDGAR